MEGWLETAGVYELIVETGCFGGCCWPEEGVQD